MAVTEPVISPEQKWDNFPHNFLDASLFHNIKKTKNKTEEETKQISITVRNIAHSNNC